MHEQPFLCRKKVQSPKFNVALLMHVMVQQAV